MILFFDTETTAKDPREARIVQLAAVLYDVNSTERATLNVLIRPEGFVIPPETTAIHGITNELAHVAGVREDFALDLFLDLLARAKRVVGHNISYDMTVTAAAVHRAWKNDVTWPETFCTMLGSMDIVKLPGRWGKFKWPKLTEAYEFFFPGETFPAHSALGDVRACKRVYSELLKRAARVQ